MQIQVDEIIVRRRVRKNLGDLGSLMDSMKKYGLLNPVTVTSEHELIAGHRRLESAKRLGWATIEVRIVDRPDDIENLEIEIDENTQRKNLTTDELAEAYLRLERLKNPGFFRRLILAIKRFFRRLFGGRKRR